MATRQAYGRNYVAPSIGSRIRAILFSSQGFPIFLTLASLGILFVLFRMKGVELDYKLSDEQRKVEKLMVVNKGLKAAKARKLSVNQLRRMARKHRLKRPKQQQIIVIP